MDLTGRSGGVNRKVFAAINMVNTVCLIDSLLFPSNVSSKCPAIIQGEHKVFP